MSDDDAIRVATRELMAAALASILRGHTRIQFLETAAQGLRGKSNENEAAALATIDDAAACYDSVAEVMTRFDGYDRDRALIR